MAINHVHLDSRVHLGSAPGGSAIGGHTGSMNVLGRRQEGIPETVSLLLDTIGLRRRWFWKNNDGKPLDTASPDQMLGRDTTPAIQDVNNTEGSAKDADTKEQATEKHDAKKAEEMHARQMTDSTPDQTFADDQGEMETSEDDVDYVDGASSDAMPSPPPPSSSSEMQARQIDTSEPGMSTLDQANDDDGDEVDDADQDMQASSGSMPARRNYTPDSPSVDKVDYQDFNGVPSQFHTRQTQGMTPNVTSSDQAKDKGDNVDTTLQQRSRSGSRRMLSRSPLLIDVPSSGAQDEVYTFTP